METIKEKLEKVINAKNALKTSINNMGGNITDSTPFINYADEIDNIVSESENNIRFAEPYASIIDNKNEYIKEYTLIYKDSDGTDYVQDETGDTIKKINSINNYLAIDLPEFNLNMLPTDRENYSGKTMSSIEFIVIHDTASASYDDDVVAMSNWCVSEENTSSSWHYTVGNRKIYKQLEDNIIGFHAGDGIDTALTWSDTDIPYTKNRPNVTLGDDGYFYIEGTATSIKYPTTANEGICDLGIICARSSNNTYQIPNTYVNSTYKKICCHGGNNNGIAIEMCVDHKSDLFYTMHLTAKLSAYLLVKYNLTTDRVWFHNNFSGKDCPMTLIADLNATESYNLIQMLINMIEIEYFILKNGYNIKFKNSAGEEISGRITSGTLPSTGKYSPHETTNYLVNDCFYLTATKITKDE